jgi:hypothetical protein
MVTLRLWIIAFDVFTFFVIASLIRMVWTKTCFLRHRKKRFLTMEEHGKNNSQGVFIGRCYCFGEDGKPTDTHRFLMRWFCDACDSMGEHCWDKTGEWKLEHGKVVPDEKRWANRG